MDDTDDTVAVTIRVPRDVWREIRVEAAREDKSAAEWVRESLALVLKRVRQSA